MGIFVSWAFNTPLFVCGSLQPSEPPFRFLDLYVQEVMGATLDNFSLFVRDGLPFIKGGKAEENCSGYLLWAKEEPFEEFQRIVSIFEPPSHYQMTEISVEMGLERVHAVTNIGLRPDLGNAVKYPRNWSMINDPLLSDGLPASKHLLDSILSNLRPVPADMNNYWRQLIPLEGIYLFLWTVIERLTTLLYGKGLGLGEKVFIFEQEIIFRRILELSNSEKLVVMDKYLEESSSFLESHYAVRNNLSHQGKNGIHDFDLLKSATRELQLFLTLFWDEVPSLSNSQPLNLLELRKAFSTRQEESARIRRASKHQLSQEF